MNEALKKELWEIWNSEKTNGNQCRQIADTFISGQIYWRYDYIIDNLPAPNGGGILLMTGFNGEKLLLDLLRRYFRCIVVDPDIKPENQDDIQSELHEELAGKLSDEDIRAIVCLTVPNENQDRQTLMQYLDLIEAPIIITFQFGNDPPAYEQQLTSKSLYDMSRSLRNHFVSRFEKCPIIRENNKSKSWPVGLLLLPA